MQQELEKIPSSLPLAVRTDKEIFLRTTESIAHFPGGKRMKYSKDGQKFAFCDSEKVYVCNSKNGKIETEIACPRVIYIMFSPKGSHIVIWRRYQTDKNNVGEDNVLVFDSKTGEMLYTTIIKRQEKWEPMYTPDEKYFGQMHKNEIHFYDTSDFKNGVKAKVRAEGVSDYAMSPGEDPCVALFVPSLKGKPSAVQIHRMSNLNIMTSKKNFFGASEVDFLWNFDGSRLLVKATFEEVGDKSNYMANEGELYYMTVEGNENFDCKVDLTQGGSSQVHDVKWSPKQDCFVVVHGHSPAKAHLFGKNCKNEFNFESPAYRNTAEFSDHGNILCLAGFGNLRGTMEYWDVKTRKLVSRYTAADSTMWSWCPDSEHLITATTSPRLRIDNQLTIWNYNGNSEVKIAFEHLGEFLVQPCLPGILPLKPTISVQSNTTAAARPAAYRPRGAPALPAGLREQPAATGISALEEKLNNKTKGPPPGYIAPEQKMTKAQLKNKKKREAKAKAKAAESEENKADNKKEETPKPDAAESEKQTLLSEQEIQKRLRNVKKKFGQIQDLKKKQAEGASLEENQLAKIKSEDAVQKEIEQLQASLEKLKVK